jgi:hypothetical protein
MLVYICVYLKKKQICHLCILLVFGEKTSIEIYGMCISTYEIFLTFTLCNFLTFTLGNSIYILYTYIKLWQLPHTSKYLKGNHSSVLSMNEVNVSKPSFTISKLWAISLSKSTIHFYYATYQWRLSKKNNKHMFGLSGYILFTPKPL